MTDTAHEALGRTAAVPRSGAAPLFDLAAKRVFVAGNMNGRIGAGAAAQRRTR
jgi:hypothetical protein